MKIRILILFLIFNCFKVKSQANDSIYVKELKKSFKVLDFQIEDSKIFNVVVSFNNEQLKYGKWKFYHDNGNIKSEGFISLKIYMIGCATEPRIPRYEEKRIGEWKYWNQNRKTRTDLVHPEIPYEGDYRVFDNKKRVIQEGYFINGELMTGKKYTYFNGPNYAIGIDSYRNGKYLGKNWK